MKESPSELYKSLRSYRLLHFVGWALVVTGGVLLPGFQLAGALTFGVGILIVVPLSIRASTIVKRLIALIFELILDEAYYKKYPRETHFKPYVSESQRSKWGGGPCTACGTPNEAGQEYCRRCGRPLLS